MTEKLANRQRWVVSMSFRWVVSSIGKPSELTPGFETTIVRQKTPKIVSPLVQSCSVARKIWENFTSLFSRALKTSDLFRARLKSHMVAKKIYRVFYQTSDNWNELNCKSTVDRAAVVQRRTRLSLIHLCRLLKIAEYRSWEQPRFHFFDWKLIEWLKLIRRVVIQLLSQL